jgi:hypothetical protein
MAARALGVDKILPFPGGWPDFAEIAKMAALGQAAP